RLLAWGIDPVELAGRLIDAYLQQLLVDGFVHVDPHPGNLMVEQNGTLVFVDFGMMGTITPGDRKGIADLATALLTRDLDGAVKALDDLGFLRHKTNTEPLKKALAFLLDRLTGVKLQPGPEFDRFLDEFRDWLYEEPLQFPARYLYIGRAVGLLAGLATTLNPGVDWVKVLKERALPLLEAAGTQPGEGAGEEKTGFDWRKLVSEYFGPGAATAVDVVLKQAGATGMSLVRLPGQLERTLAKVESGSVQVQTDLSALTESLDRQNRYASRLAWALVAGGAGIAGAILRVGGAFAETRVAWAISAVALLLLLANTLFGGRKGRRRTAPHPNFRRSR
ncbi:MAG TPA: AarF/UbiB family protein, partial [Symbiobacteriaceae bacterium]|nr:AarF/UbiB family protein [Symbiobacteriaceae bacterium]